MGGGAVAASAAKSKDDNVVWGPFPHEEHASLMDSIYHMVASFLRELLMTIFSTLPVSISGDRASVTRSAFFLILFQVIHAVGNLHVFLGPDDFNGYGYFYVRLYWTGFGFNANIVEEYLLLAAAMHVLVGLKRTVDINMGRPLNSGALNMAISGVTLLLFMIVHLFQFRFGATDPYKLRPPPYLINLSELPHLFFTEDKSVPFVAVRDIYKLEFEVFNNIGGVIYYLFSTIIFALHYMWGWEKVVPASQLGIPKSHQGTVKLMGKAIGAFVALCYLSFPIYAFAVGPSPGVYGAGY